MRPIADIGEIRELDELANATLGLRAAGDWDREEHESALDRIRAACDAMFARLDPAEAELVRLLLARRTVTVAAARTFDQAGKGLMYPVLAAGALLVDGASAAMAILACAIATAVSMAVYPMLKHLVRRERPCAFDAELGVGIAPMDRFSWPSGHSITAVAFLVPFGLAASSLLPLIAPLVLLVLWSRVALGHHYPTDVIAGSALGAAISGSISCALVL